MTNRWIWTTMLGFLIGGCVPMGEEDGDGDLEPSPGPELPTLPITRATKIVTGNGFACALTTGGTVRCWGYPGEVESDALRRHSHFGTTVFPTVDQANQTATRVQRPVEVPGLTDVIDIETGYETVCALTSSKKMYCWGRNDQGQVGNGTDIGVVEPYELPLENVKKIAVATLHTCALLEDASVKCWGSESVLEGVSLPIQSLRLSPVDVPHAQGATDLFASDRATIIVRGGESYWFGDTMASTTDSNQGDPPPRLVPNVPNPRDFRVGNSSYASCAIISGAAKCWGTPSTGLLGTGATHGDQPGPGPHQVAGLTSGVTSLDYGAAVMNGRLYRWGPGPLGNGLEAAIDMSLLPVEIGALSDVVQVRSGNPICALTGGGSVYCWGNNENGQVGVGTQEFEYRTPQKVLWFE